MSKLKFSLNNSVYFFIFQIYFSQKFGTVGVENSKKTNTIDKFSMFNFITASTRFDKEKSSIFKLTISLFFNQINYDSFL